VEANLETSLFEPGINIFHMCPQSIGLIQHTEAAKDGEGNLLSILSANFSETVVPYLPLQQWSANPPAQQT
jgi:hypothetical protein